MSAAYISYVRRNPESSLDVNTFPGSLPFVPELNLEFTMPVTFFVGENGSGKSTLLEAIALLAGFPIDGGGTCDTGASHGLGADSLLANSIRTAFKRRPRDGYFFRAELQAHFASLLDQRDLDPYFRMSGHDPYERYGGRSLHGMSHGEAFLSVMRNRFSEGLFLMDEPESALSPQRQLTLLAIMYDLAQNGKTQFIIATHSPILLTFPGARIVSFDEMPLQTISFQDTSHYQITRGILTSPESYWKHLRMPRENSTPPSEEDS